MQDSVRNILHYIYMMATTTRNSLSLYSLICWLLIVNFVAAGPLCSAFCLQTGCTDYTPTTCSGGWKCNANWVWNAAIPECDVDTTKNREFIDCSSDATSYSAGGAITVTPNTFPSTSCPAITTTQFWGSYTANQVITTTLPGGTIISHYAL